VPEIQDASYIGSVMFKPKNEVVNLVLVHSEPVGAGGIPREAHERFAREWDYYAWDKMLTRHGLPSEILFGIDPTRVLDDHGAWGLILLYESLGMAIEYVGPAPLAPVEASFARACLRFDEVILLRVYLIDPKDSITRYFVEVRGSYIVRQSLEKTCGMTNEEAYELLKDSGSNVCLEQALPGR
jgi:hypothetical protein